MQSKVVGMDTCIRCAVLVSLSSGSSHGYELAGTLHKMKLFSSPDKKGVSVYSYLRKMEIEGLILSEWSIEESKKPKRVYFITEEGKTKLAEVAADISECATALFELIEIYRRQVLS